MNLEGKLLGNRYEIIEKIGNGGMATVYKAEDKILKRFVAVKILRDEFTTDDEFIKRFEIEAQSAARLTHPNIVSIYDVGIDGDLYFIVMELIKGKTLKEIIIEEKGALPWKWSVNVAIQIASALEMAHRNNIIHRDIKPHNIIITEDGIAKVTDFGIAKAVSNSTITAFGTTIGSVHYFSPEHAKGGFTDVKSDIYSLGVVMFEMVTGEVPFDADTPVSVALKHMQEEPKEPASLNSEVPEAVNKIVMKALKKDPELRYQTSTQMLEDLKESLKNPNGDFVEEIEYDETAKTQVLSSDEIEKAGRNNKNKKKDGKFKTFIKKHKKLSIFIGIITVFILALGGTMGVLSLTNPPEVDMPNIVNISKDEAQKKTEEAGLKFEIEKEEYNKDIPQNNIISQDPTYMEKYHKVKKGSTVKVVVSKGAEEVTVPKVSGMKKDDAIKALETAKLKVEIIEEESKKVEVGYVINQDTEANTKAYAGDTVKIHISTGVKQVTIPNVIGKTEEEATKALEGAGLVVSVTSSEDSTKDSGIVLKQSLDSGKTVNQGSSITITVNSYEASKSISVSINVKAIAGEYVAGDNDTNTTGNKPKTVTIVIMQGGKEIYRDTGVDRNSTNKTTTIQGKGSNEINLIITDTNGGKWTRTTDVNYSNDTTVTFN